MSKLFSVVILFLFLMILPGAVVFTGISSWFCNPCPSCSTCPACQPRIEVLPHCEYQSNLNQCNCDCVSTAEFSKHQELWTSHLFNRQQENFQSHWDIATEKKRLLYWLLGLSFAGFLLILVIIGLIFFSPIIQRRLRKWRIRSQQARRQYLMRKHNLVEKVASTTALAIISSDRSETPLNLERNELSFSSDQKARYKQPM